MPHPGNVTTELELTPWPSDPAARGRAMAAAGVIGGRRPGAGRPRRDRFSLAIAEAMEPHVDEVVEALRAGLADSNMRTRVMAARAAVDLAVRHDAVAQRDDHHTEDVYARMSAQEVRSAFASVLLEMVNSGELAAGDVFAELPILDVETVEEAP